MSSSLRSRYSIKSISTILETKLVVNMSRTKKDIMVPGRTAEEIRVLVQNWFAGNDVEVIDNKPNYIKGRWGIGLATAPKYFQVSFLPTQGGVIAQTEGWIGVYGISEQSFSATALMGGIPRREGWQAMERLWSTLQAFSKTPSRFCPACGRSIMAENVNFCPHCGKPLG